MKLTPKQKKIYDYILAYRQKHNFTPTLREIMLAMNLKSTSTVHFHLKNLEKAGLIAIEPGKSRAITVLDQPEGDDKTRIPVLGSVAAGSPILARECVEEYLTLDSVGHRGDCFALRVHGESMLNAGIFPGDYVVVRRQSEANNGEIVAALIGDERTVKRYEVRNGQVWLMPENETYLPISGANARILGIVTAVFRMYDTCADKFRSDIRGR